MLVDRTGISQLTSLRDEVNAAVEHVLKTDNVALPSHDSLNSAIFPPAPSVLEAIVPVKELLALLQGTSAVFERSFGYHVASALRVALEAHVAETLREAKEIGKDGLHAEEIAKSSIVDPAKLARILRLLAAHHIFVEKEPDVFALSRSALWLDTGKSVKELRGTKDWYSGTNGFAAAVGLLTDESLKASAYLTETLLDPKTSHSQSPEQAAIVRALNLEKSAWEYFATDDVAGPRFSAAMRFPFDSLPRDALVVDVGSGIGGVSLELIKTAPHLKLVLQDRPSVIEQAKMVWEKEQPEAIKSGHVQLVVHDFFQPQPVKYADVYFLRAIIHDWADEYALQILRHLASAASPNSKLVLIESPIDYVPSSGRVHSVAPFLLDIQMMAGINSLERTEEMHRELGKKAGWKLVKVWKTGPDGHDGAFRHYEFVVDCEQNGA
ncbi:hypothetical protein JCM8547_005156 [Rhodosporidiobolus lusitaniae]